jgi:acetylornithine deacetylase ArgE|tara:strand:+ start:52 stop:1176 length:1125 start_codon:yes stop_codon:yes gene_type:complete
LTVIDIAKSLISFDTSGPPAKEMPLAKWIRDFLMDLSVDVELQEVEKDRANVIAKIGEGAGPGLILSGHIDTVLAGDPALWSVSGPFEPVVRDGRVYGRGASDMKGPCASMIQAAKEIRKEGLKRQLTLVFTAGEDTGGWFVDRVLKEGKVTKEEARFGVVGEPTMLKVGRTHKGYAYASLVVNGKAAHSSRPETGINAITRGAEVLRGISELQDELNGSPHPLMGPSTIKPTLIKGGIKSNIIPNRCEITLNARLIPAHADVHTIKGWLRRLIGGSDKGYEGSVEVTVPKVRNPLDIPGNSEIVKLLTRVLGSEPVGVSYFSEAGDYTEAGIPTVLCGPGSIDQGHTANEFIAIDQLKKGVKVYKRIIEEICL